MKSSLITILASLVILEGALAITVTDVWQSLKITNPSTLSRPQDIRTATVGWKINTADVLPNDNFFLLMPYVFRTKFDGKEILLKAGDTVYAKCDVHDGSFDSDTSYLKCSMTSSMDNAKDLTATGEIKFDFVFNAGGSSKDADISSAKQFSSGDNQVSFNNMKSNVNFQPGPFFTDKKNDELLYYSRSIPQDLEQVFVLSGVCNEGIKSGTIVYTTNHTMDCSQFQLKMTNDLNDFYLPKSYESVSVGSIKCSGDNMKLTATFNDIPPGYRVFLEGFEKYPENTNYVKHLYAENIKCGDGSSKVDGITKIINVIVGISSSSGSVDVSSSIEPSSSVENTSICELSTTIPCNECVQSTPFPTTETETTRKTNTLTKTVCTECAHSTNVSVSMSEPSYESILSTIRTSDSETNNSVPSTSESVSSTIQTSESETSNSVSSTSESASSELSSETSVISTSCDDCSYSSILPTSVSPSVSATHTELQTEETFPCVECSSSGVQTQTETNTRTGTTTDTISCHECSTSLIWSTSIPSAIGTTKSESYHETSTLSETRTESESSTGNKALSTIISDTTSDNTHPSCSGADCLPDSSIIPDTPKDIVSCDDCTTTWPTYVPDESSSSKSTPRESHISTATSSNLHSNIADTSISAHATTTRSEISTRSHPDDSLAPASPSKYNPSVLSSAPYIPPYSFSSYEALANIDQCSTAVLLLSIFALLV